MNDNNERAPHLMSCAGQWLLRYGNLDPQRLVWAGPHFHSGGDDTPWCLPGETPCWHSSAWLNHGQSSAAEWINTDRMLTAKGQYQLAEHVGHWVKLWTLKPEWFTLSGSQD